MSWWAPWGILKAHRLAGGWVRHSFGAVGRQKARRLREDGWKIWQVVGGTPRAHRLEALRLSHDFRRCLRRLRHLQARNHRRLDVRGNNLACF